LILREPTVPGGFLALEATTVPCANIGSSTSSPDEIDPMRVNKSQRRAVFGVRHGAINGADARKSGQTIGREK
jgi:hypothetical protein